MSLFRDDFYSTKPTRRSMRTKRQPDGTARRQAGMIWPAALLFGCGMLLIVVILVIGSQANIQPVSGEAEGQHVSNGLQNSPENGAGNGAAGGEAPGNGQGKGTGTGAGSNSGTSDGELGSSPDASGGHGSGSDSNSGGTGTDSGEVVYRNEISRATAKVYDAVVSIATPAEGGDADWLDVYAIGSGIIFRIDGDDAYIVTNHHVAVSAEELEVVLVNGEKKSAQLIGSDLISDLAILKMDADGIEKTAVFGSSSDLQLGETAIAIGSPLGLGYAHTITSGVVSSTNRIIPVSLSGNGSLDWEMEVIQTDAAINSGNSGGALINIDGEVIGINTMKIAWFGVEGMGFAIPIDLAGSIIEELIAAGKVSRPYIGIGGINLSDYYEDEALDLPSDVKGGAVVLSVDGPAKKAGLQEDDVIVRLDEQAIRNMIDLRKYLYEVKQIGDTIDVTVYRDGRERVYSLVLGELP